MDIDALRACEYWTEREGRAAVALWRSSGLSAKAFARSVGLAPARLAYWRCRVEAAAGTMTVAPMTLAPVTVIDRRPRAIVIELLCGRAVRVEGDFDDALLARVIAAAERSC